MEPLKRRARRLGQPEPQARLLTPTMIRAGEGLRSGNGWTTIEREDQAIEILVTRPPSGTRTVSIRLKHRGQLRDKPFGGTALVSVLVSERLRFQSSKNKWIELFAFPGITGAEWTLAPEHANNCILAIQPLSSHGEEPLVVWDARRKTKRAVDYRVTYKKADEKLQIEPLSLGADPYCRLGRVLAQIDGDGSDVEVASPELHWKSLGDLEPFARFAEKTGWMRTWQPRIVGGGQHWRLYDEPGTLAGDDKQTRGPSHPQFLITNGSGRWPLVNDLENRFTAPCLLGFPHVLPDAKKDHIARSARWLRQWRAWHAQPDRSSNPDLLAPWFEAGFPLLGIDGQATADKNDVEVLTCSYHEDLHRLYRETWIQSGVHLAVRTSVGGPRVWDALLGTMQSRGSRIFASQHPTEVDSPLGPDGAPKRWPTWFGDQVPIAQPVASQTNYETVLRLLPEIPRNADGPWTTSSPAAVRELEQMPPGVLIRQGRKPAGLLMVPSGFAVIIDEPPHGTETEPVIAGVYRTPRFFGDLELTKYEYYPARSSVIAFCESYDDDEVPEKRPLRLGLGFLVSYCDLQKMIGDWNHAGGSLYQSFRQRFRELSASALSYNLFCARDPFKSMREWLYREWCRIGSPATMDEALPLSELLIACVLAHGEPATPLDVKRLWKIWEENNNNIRKRLIAAGVIAQGDRKKRTRSYSDVQFTANPALGTWNQRRVIEGAPRVVESRREDARRLATPVSPRRRKTDGQPPG